MPQPLVSILIPSFNHARYLGACLDSVLAQTFENWEVILVDDGSSDDSLAIAQSFASREPRIKVFQNEKNLGTYGTEQRALELSSGEFIAILNSDDLWLKDKLLRQINALLDEPKASFCYTLGWMADSEGSVDQNDDVHADWPTALVQEILPWLLCENRILASSVLFRREGLSFHPECRYSGDWVALLEQSMRGHAICIPERLTLWRQHDSNSYVRSEKQVIEEIWIRKAIALRAENWKLSRFREEERAKVQEKLSMNSLNLHALGVLTNQKELSQSAIMEAVRLLPNSRIVKRRRLLSLLPQSIQRKRLFPGENITLLSIKEESFQFKVSENP